MCFGANLYLLRQHYGSYQLEKAKKHRDAAVIARLIDIRKAQLEYRTYMTSNILQASTL